MFRHVACSLGFAAGSSLAAQDPSGVDLAPDQLPSLRALGQAPERRLDDWIDRFTLSGFVAARAFDTARGGTRPDGAIGIQAATLFVDVAVKDTGSVFVELRLDYFAEAGSNQVDIGEAYAKFQRVLDLGNDTGLGVKVGRFDLPFGEYYLQEDPDRNRLIGFPAVLPYRWDEGAMAFADNGTLGFAAAVTDGTYSRNSQSGIAPAVTLRVHARPGSDLYLSASGLYIHAADQGALCLGGSLLTPVTGGAAGASPNAEARFVMSSLDAIWEPAPELRVQGSVGSGRVDDGADAFDRTLLWWMFEPSVQFAPGFDATLRWSGGGTFADREGYQLEGRPYGNGAASYGFDLRELQRLALGVRHTFGKDLVGKVEVGFDRLVATDTSGLRNDTRIFTAAELVLSF